MSMRAISPIAGVALMLAVTITLSSVFLFFSFGFLNEEPPYILCNCRLVREEGTFGNQIIEISHSSGDCVSLNKVRIVVEVWRNNTLLKKCSLRNFPWNYQNSVKAENIVGDQFIDRRAPRFQKVNGYCYLGELAGDGLWTLGEKVGFRIKKTDQGVRLKVGDLVVVKIIHIPSGCIVSQKKIVIDAT